MMNRRFLEEAPRVKVDIFNHIWPRPYFEAVQRYVPKFLDMGKRVTSVPMLMDLDIRFRVMDAFDDYYRHRRCARYQGH